MQAIYVCNPRLLHRQGFAATAEGVLGVKYVSKGAGGQSCPWSGGIGEP